MTLALTILHLLIFAAVSLRVLSRPQLNTSTRVVWIFVLLVLPIGGLFLYLFVGEVHFGGPALVRLSKAKADTHELVKASGAAPDIRRWGGASAYATTINGFGVTQGNTGELLNSAEEARARLIADIDAARYSVDVLYYIWLDDNTGTAVAEALIRAAGRGVHCRAMIDAIGSRSMASSAHWKKLADAGVETAVALPLGNILLTVLTRRVDLRNHRKITVIDGNICHCGSQNCADPEFRVKPKFAPWIDIMVRFEGPVARQMHLLFIQDWLTVKSAGLDDVAKPVAPISGGFAAQVVGTGPTVSREITAQLFSRLIFEAEREIVISTPYFVPGEIVCLAIMGAARAGVKVTLILPHRNDSSFVARASRSYYPSLIEAGVNIVEFNGGLLHSKTLTIDGQLTFMGSSNLDIRSFDLNFENDVLFRDTRLTEDIRARQLEYVAASTPIDPDAVRRWPIYRRIWLNAFALLGPIL
ncbi:MAG: cardiolipin synthase [Mesorhizobium sp.]